ncbi:Sapep family Mn(2+)-dependent dipeptidase [Granulicatella adiacens ATCC 49175]|uniref:Putative dipeptidase n=1 Tax=Granulicatella adiacens ATCC 49175 TaxID=638301 RepID=C8NIX8_9LACT|nr:Sapep family Mn(2+)-dependent dipeptidase [Granulicatella adiacens]EEW36525.1 putative dipeptidase [Granulicatella adiacens ATCC 49175]UAK92918.1 Sapep family Mn(2+)-dependent dipeptidase [Granulicatella adiacens]UWP38103.1 Sapep family Mn(2+)-dependent dipeptidase [Granulicatella adiacens ATCC 49175]
MNREEWINRLKEVQPMLFDGLRRMVAIPSIRGKEEPDAPFGRGPKQALEEVLKIATELGFHTKNIDDKIGYAEYGENRADGAYYGVFGHVDVMPLGEGWNSPPLSLTLREGKLFGRGTLDNKGPILSNLYALYVLKENGVTFDRPVRIVFGTNEETGFGCVKHYLTKEIPPTFGWTPDCKWPVVYGERGRLKVRVSVPESMVADLYDFANCKLLHTNHRGEELGIAYHDEDFGMMQLRGETFGIEENQHYVEWTMCYPASCTKSDLLNQITAQLPEKATLEVISHWAPVLYDKSSKYVQALQQVYTDVTKSDSIPVTTTGGTYAKIIPNIIAYGPSFPGQRDIAHLPNEWIGVKDLETDTIIYGLALLALSNMKEGMK